MYFQIVIILIILLLLYRYISVKNTIKKIPAFIPVAKGFHPMFGHLKTLQKHVSEQKSFALGMCEMAKENGLNFGLVGTTSKPMLMICDPDIIRVAATKSRQRSKKVVDVFGGLIGVQGLFTDNGDRWKKVRGIMRPSMFWSVC